MYQGPADEVVVVVKIAANDGLVTGLRIKPQSSDRKSRRRMEQVSGS